jgi:predicted GTPase
VRVGLRLLELARARSARAIFVVGTGKNVGKTTALGAIYEAAWQSGLRVGVASIGPKPRLRLQPNTVFATARPRLPRSPAVEVLKISHLESSAGKLLYARTVYGGFYELAGPSSVSGLREAIDEISAQCDLILVDGAIDRISTLASSAGAIVVSCGAAAAKTASEAVSDVAALTARLRIPPFDPHDAAIEWEGALTATIAAGFISAGEERQIVVDDPTQIVMSGRSLTEALTRLRIRCRRPLDVVAITVCAVAPEHSFDPAGFLHAVADATKLPAFDVFAGQEAA